MVNKEIANGLLNNLKNYISQLRDAKDINYRKFKLDIRSQRFVVHTLQIAVESAMDIAHHIISDDKMREPKTYAEAFAVLAENGVISEGMENTGRMMAQFRNKIVHNYEDVDLNVLYSIFTNKLDDFEQFICEIEEWINSNTAE